MSAERDLTDPALDALLREHSAESPPRAVDAAILAAAHRAVGSSPHRRERASATRSWRWWMPLAAAAVIGVVVIGVLPLAPPIVDDAAPVVSDSPRLPPRSMSGGTGETASKQERAATPQSPPPVRAQVPDAAAARSDASRNDGETPLAKRDAADLAARATPKVEGSRATAPNPFPLEANRPSAAEPVPMQKRQSASDAATSAPSLAAPSAKSSVAAAGSLAAKNADAETRPATEWIARIRALRNEGRLPEATQELARFRAAFGDADARLPEDLRSWADAIPR